MWLDEENKTEPTAMAEVKEAVKRWRELKFKMDEAESMFAEAKRVYEKYCSEVVAQVFRHNGLESLRMEDGSEVSVVSKVRCSVLKDHVKGVAQWLREHDAENLVTATLTVPTRAARLLEQNLIPYEEEVRMNTNQIKAFVKGEMEAGNVTTSDLPSGLSWYMYDDIVYKDNV